MAENGLLKSVFLVGVVVAVMSAWGVVTTEAAISCNQEHRFQQPILRHIISVCVPVIE